MREIKFRAWDLSRKKMWTAEQMGIDELTLNPDGRGFVNVSGASQKLSQYMSHIMPMQYTGIRDKHGVEIYEGDIIYLCYTYEDARLESGWGWIVVIEWDNRQEEEEHFQGFNVPFDGEHCEVIGNIYENPELLDFP